MIAKEEVDSQLDLAVSVLTALGGMVERLRQVAGWLQVGRRVTARDELQLLLAQLDELIATLAEGPAAVPLDEKELMAELRLVREDIASVGFFPNI